MFYISSVVENLYKIPKTYNLCRGQNSLNGHVCYFIHSELDNLLRYIRFTYFTQVEIHYMYTVSY